MDIKGELSLTEIHKSIETSLNSLKQQHTEVRDAVCDVKLLKRIVDCVIKPASDAVRQEQVTGGESLRILLENHKLVVRKSLLGGITGQINDATLGDSPGNSLTSKNAENNQRTMHRTRSCILPPVARPSTPGNRRIRAPATSGVRYPPITNTSLVHTPKGRLPSPPKLPSPQQIAATSNNDPAEVHDELTRYYDDVETHTCALQSVFTSFTQRVLVPLQTFCKQHRTR
uniref:Uncharacterized protein n=1 Tax=Ciona savignyi TaxID=51511 RepID=H2YJJ9_CIOSA